MIVLVLICILIQLVFERIRQYPLPFLCLQHQTVSLFHLALPCCSHLIRVYSARLSSSNIATVTVQNFNFP